MENVWHLVDLEREGYGLRIRRMLAEDTPALLNFDGERIARERCYNEKDVTRGIAAFARARTQNLEVLRRLSASEWRRAGALEGVGRVTLEDLPRMMADDRSHGDESRPYSPRRAASVFVARNLLRSRLAPSPPDHEPPGPPAASSSTLSLRQ